MHRLKNSPYLHKILIFKYLSFKHSLWYPPGLVRWILPFTVGFLWAVLCSGQGTTSANDSLAQLLDANPGDKTVKEVILYGKAKQSEGKYEAFSQALELAMKHIESVSSDSLRMELLNVMGNAYMLKTDFPSAAAHYLKALRLAEEVKDTLGIFITSGNMASMHNNMNEWETAMEYYLKGQNLVDSSGFQVPTDNILIRSINIAISLIRLKKYDEAREWLNKTLNLSEEEGITGFLGPIYNTIGTSYQEENKLEQALPYFKECLVQSRANGQHQYVAVSYQNIAGNFDELGQHDSAIVYLNQGLEMVKRLKLKRMEEEFLRGLAENHFRNKDYESAYLFIRRRTSLRDSLYGKKRKEKIAELEEKYEAEKRLLEIEMLKTENQQNQLELAQNQLLSVGLLALLLLVALGFTVYFFRNRLQTSNRISSLKQKALRAQMNPHFTFNALSAIQNSLLKDDKMKASDFLARFARLTRRILVSASKDEVSLEEELDQLDLYLSLEQLRMNNHFDFEIQVDESIDREMQRVPTLLLQPFLENAIWHGMTHKPTPGKIQVKVSPEKDMLRIVIEDNGVGREEASKKRATSSENSPMGMRITKERLELYRLLHRTSIGVAVEDLKDGQQQAKGTRVELLIPA